MPMYSIKAGFGRWDNLWFRLKSKWSVRRSTTWIDTPIIINNFNRLHFLRKQIAWLESAGLKNIHIIDNASAYPPLLKWYQECTYPVYRLNKNIGHEALWKTHIYQRFMHDYYVLTDPDVLPSEDLPPHFLHHFFEILHRHPQYLKVGFGLKIDDIPDFFPKKQEVIQWESSLDEFEVEPGVWKSKIDTTFALYRPGAQFQCWDQTLRLSAPYQLKHMPWYENPERLTEESAYYYATVNPSSSWVHSVKGTDQRYTAWQK